MKTKSKLWMMGIMLAVVIAGAGCGTFLTPHSEPTSYPVQALVASTNDSPLVAWLKVAAVANQTANVTPSQAPVGAILGGLIALASVAAGWYGRHKGSTTDVKSTRDLCENFRPPTTPTKS
jgi:hypothetical protein